MNPPNVHVIDLGDRPVPSSVPRMPLKEWQQEAIQRGRGNILDCGFRCPLCGKVSTARDFERAGADGEQAAFECIGRVVGANGGLYLTDRRPNPNPRAQPCDWAAYGLMGTLDSGVAIVMPDGQEILAFSFADEDEVST